MHLAPSFCAHTIHALCIRLILSLCIHISLSLYIPLDVCAVAAGGRATAGAGVADLSRLGSYPPYGCHLLAGAIVAALFLCIIDTDGFGFDIDGLLKILELKILGVEKPKKLFDGAIGSERATVQRTYATAA
jgi:hypothetical protein